MYIYNKYINKYIYINNIYNKTYTKYGKKPLLERVQMKCGINFYQIKFIFTTFFNRIINYKAFSYLCIHILL